MSHVNRDLDQSQGNPHPAHKIRLHGPWNYSVVENFSRDDAHPVVEGTIPIPSDWAATLGSDFRGRVRYSRNFGKPTGLTPQDRVELVCECVDALGRVELNGSALGFIPPGLATSRFEITQWLEPRNRLIIEVDLPQANAPHVERPGRELLAGGIVGEVRLEIFTG